jgi:hypothetical protein
MGAFFGWVLIIGAIVLLFSAFKRREPAAGEARPTGPNRGYLWGAVAALLVGVALALWPSLAIAQLKPVPVSRTDKWVTNPVVAPDAPVHWAGNALVVDLEAGSGRYAVFPADWEADRFEAEWDMTFTHLDRGGDPMPLKLNGQTVTQPRNQAHDFASVAIGVMDQNAANIDDRDHVSGSGIEACFSDDIRLRSSDANYIVRSAGHDESGKTEIDPKWHKGTPVAIELNKKYHCKLAYDRRTNDATLDVRDETGAVVTSRRLEDIKELTNSVSWFGVTVRGYNRFDKKLDPKKGDTGYTRPRAVVRIENLTYRQP